MRAACPVRTCTTMGNAASTPGLDDDAEVRASPSKMERRFAVNANSPAQLNFDIAYEVVKHADVRDMARAACACKALYALRDSDTMWWRASCEALGASARLYVPRTATGGPIHGGTWRDHFFHLYAARDRWCAPDDRGVEDLVRARFARLIEAGESAPDASPNTIYSRDASSPTSNPAPPTQIGGVQIEHGCVKVCVRMRPTGVGVTRNQTTEISKSNAVVLPLHQRLRIIKARCGESCGTGEAMRVLMQDSGRGAEASRSPWADADAMAAKDAKNDDGDGGDGERKKPDSETGALKDVTNENDSDSSSKNKPPKPEKQTNPRSGFEFTCGVLSVDELEGRVLAVAPGVGLREFAFDAVFGATASQRSVYEKTGAPLVSDLINGVNGAMLVYGQTGSGKTHTMFGDSDSTKHTMFGGAFGVSGVSDAPSISVHDSQQGVVPRACSEILAACVDRHTKFGIQWRLTVSYVEVFGQEVFDLLNGGAHVGQSRVAARRYVLDGHTDRDVTSDADVSEILKTGDLQKRKAATAMNDRSSRAHCVFSLHLTQTLHGNGVEANTPIRGAQVTEVTNDNLKSEVTNNTGTNTGTGQLELTSRLCLVDLGGSEKLGKSLANAGALAPGTVPWGEYYQSRRLMAEATNINVGLLALKRVVDALHLIKKARREGKQPPHVPYGDSKLTEILSDALGGDGKTTVLVTVASEHEHAIESVQTLRFGERCASVETKAKVGQNALRGMLAALNLSIGELEVRIKLCEKWVTTTTTRRDAHSGMDETVVSSKLGGAESLRTELEGMLAERTFLLGRVAVGTTKKDEGIDAHL